MTDAPTAAQAPASEARDVSGTFTVLEDALRATGPAAALDRLIEHLDASRRVPGLARCALAQGPPRAGASP